MNNKTNYAFNYVRIRETNIKRELRSVYDETFMKLCKVSARNRSNGNLKKDWKPDVIDKMYASQRLGEWTKYDTGNFEDMLNIIDFYDVLIYPDTTEEEFRKEREVIKVHFRECVSKTEGFAWDDDLNYNDNEQDRYDIFVDLFFRDKDDNPTLHYNYIDDIVIWDKRDSSGNKMQLTKSELRGIWRNYGKGRFTEKREEPINDTFENRIRSESSVYAYDPIKEYFDNLPTWDGVARAEEYLIKYQKADDLGYIRKVTFNWLYNIVRQVYEPCQHPFLGMLVLHGQTDCGKTAVMEHLFEFDDKISGNAMDRRFTYNIRMEDEQSKIAAILRTKVAIGFGERVGISKDDNNAAKQFMDVINSNIAYQKKFKNEVTNFFPRCGVFVSTNDDKFLNDYSVYYNKRMNIVKSNISAQEFQSMGYWQETRDVRDMVWSEVKSKYMQDVNTNTIRNLSLRVEDIEELRNVQSEFNTIDVEDDVAAYLGSLLNHRFMCNIIDGYTEFATPRDFVEQANGRMTYEKYVNLNAELNVIPIAYLKAWKDSLPKKLDGRYSNAIKKFLVDNGWEYDRIYYHYGDTSPFKKAIRIRAWVKKEVQGGLF